jgi:hypothetical protein
MDENVVFIIILACLGMFILLPVCVGHWAYVRYGMEVSTLVWFITFILSGLMLVLVTITALSMV